MFVVGRLCRVFTVYDRYNISRIIVKIKWFPGGNCGLPGG